MSNENNVVGLPVGSHLKVDGSYVASPKDDPVLFDIFTRYRLAWENDQIILKNLTAENQKNVSRINQLNAEKSVIEADRNKWKKYFNYFRLIVFIQFFLFMFFRYHLG